MGCDSSKQKEQEVSDEDKRPGKSEHNKVQDGVLVAKEDHDTGTQVRVTTVDKNRNHEPKNLGQSDCKRANKTCKTSNDVQKNANRRQSPPKSGGVLNAWDAPPRGKARPLKSIEHTPGSATEAHGETEYDKEGIDLYSTSINVNTSSSPPDNIHVNSEENHKWKVMIKAETEEAFDPSNLIDIEKFKAVNAPASKKTHELPFSGAVNQEYQPDPSVVTDEPRLSAEGSRKAGGSASAELVSHTNSDFYDEDEKELMANIEKDFLHTQNVLPGAVE